MDIVTAMIFALALAAATMSPAAMVEAASERIAVAARLRCPKATGDEVIVCGRASARDRFLLPLPRVPEPGSKSVVNALGERAELAAMHKYSEPSTVGMGGEYGGTLYMISKAVGDGTFTPLHRRFEGPDVEYETLTSGK